MYVYHNFNCLNKQIANFNKQTVSYVTNITLFKYL